MTNEKLRIYLRLFILFSIIGIAIQSFELGHIVDLKDFFIKNYSFYMSVVYQSFGAGMFLGGFAVFVALSYSFYYLAMTLCLIGLTYNLLAVII